MPKRKRYSRRRDVIIGLLVSLLLGGLVLVLSKDEMLSLIVSLLGTLIALVVELIRRFDERIEAEDNHSILLAATDKLPALLPEMSEMASSARSALDDDQNKVLFSELALAKVRETRLFMQDLKRGHVRVPVDDPTPMGNQIDSVKERVRATTILAVDLEWWLSSGGRDYLGRNKRAIEERGVSIERIVIWKELDNKPELGKVIEEQRAAKVKILFAKHADIKKRELKTNMAIYDDSSYNDVAFNLDGESVYVDYYLEPSDAQLAIARYELLRGIATDEVPKELTHVARPDDPDQS